MLCAISCKTVAPLTNVDLSKDGWTTKQGQAVWKANKKMPEIAGDILVATHPDGQNLVQFSKTPFTLFLGRTTAYSWELKFFMPEERRLSGKGNPPKRFPIGWLYFKKLPWAWLYLPRCLAGLPPPKNWKWEILDNNSWRLSNYKTGESLQGYLEQ